MTRDPGDLARFGECFTRNGSPRRPESVAWQYAANPTGQLFVDFALPPAGDPLAAIYATLPVRLRIAGRVELGVQSVDTITDAAYRGRGLFLRLANQTYTRAAAAGAKLVYGFPNGSSAHGFFERLGWTQLDPVPFLIRPLRTGYLLDQLKLRRHVPFLPDLPLFFGGGGSERDVEPLAQFDARATRLWHRFSRGIDVAVERDARYLGWRLIDKPGERYENAAIRERDGELAAFASHAVKDKHGGRIGYVMEGLCAPGRGRALRRLLRRALARMTAEGADVALAWCLPHSPTYASYLRLGFVPFPTRYRPIELHFGARAFDPALDRVVRDRRSWYLSYLDSDTV